MCRMTVFSFKIMKLFFDTETTGLANFQQEANHPSQPRLVQLAVILTNEACEEISTVKILVKPDGFQIPPEASAIHGIEHEHAELAGVSAKAAVGIFVHLARAAHSLHAFNINYDRIVMLGEVLRIQGMPNPFADVEEVCEMEAMTEICQLPGRGGNFKWPKLQEAYRHAFRKDFDKAHDAMADVRAMIAVHKWRISQPPAQEEPELQL